MDQPLWVLRQYDIVQAQAMAERLGISTAAAILLQQRGCRSEEQCRYFLSPRLEDLTPPLSMSGMAAAVEIIQRTVDAKRPIVIFGDYDVDGVCSIVILRECLERLDAEVDYYIPDRFQEGYGLNTQAVQQLAQRGFGLLITVDCGIRSVEEVAAARR
ncbi:MAG TPA: single-stranded-DNA-specific exonuclease RecJ, partial [Syntrophomonas sp.]|nr:single-stranded-DNA-specific exonuclease RecJ [Syntrophomonas sp.]